MNNIMNKEEVDENKSIDNVIIVTSLEILDENESKKIFSSELKESKWKIVKNSNNKILPEISKREFKLNNIINELKNISINEQIEIQEPIEITNSSNWIKISRQQLIHYLLKPIFYYSIIVLVILDLIIVLVDLVLAQLSSPCLTDDEMEEYNTTDQRDTCLLPYSIQLSRAELFLFYLSLLLLIIFVLEIFISFYAFGWRHYTNPLYLSDSFIVFASLIMEIYFHYGNIGRAGRAAAAIVVLRLWKIIRAVQALAHSITLRNRLTIKKIQEAQIIIQDEKQYTEQMLEIQYIKVEYLSNILNKLGKLPNSQQIDNHVDKIWQQRNTPV